MDKNYEEIEFSVGNIIDDAVGILLSYKEKEILACGKFNEIILYSDTVTMDSAYKEITGKTKSEFEKDFEDYKEKVKSIDYSVIDYEIGERVYWISLKDKGLEGEYIVSSKRNDCGLVGIYNEKMLERLVYWFELRKQ